MSDVALVTRRSRRRTSTWLAGAALVALAFVPAERLLSAYDHGLLAYDFRQTFLPAAEALVDGNSPYPEYGYPPLVAFLSVPFALVPGAEFIVTGLLIACVPLSLWLFSVRDWRCYVVALLWISVFNAVQTANVTLPLLVCAAACWRWRDRRFAASAAGGLAVAAKLLAWPLAVWLAATGRARTAVGLFLVALAVTFGLWATIGFSGLVSYPDSLERLQGAQGDRGYTFQALVSDLGLAEGVGMALGLVVLAAVLTAVVVHGRRGDDTRSFAWAMVATVVGSPVIWLHSFALLLAPVAVLKPRLTWVWFVPALLWFVSPGTGNGAPWQTAVTVLAAAAVVVGALARPERTSRVSQLRRPTATNGVA